LIRIEISSNSKDEEDTLFLGLQKFFDRELIKVHSSSENSLRKEIWIEPDRFDMSRMREYVAD